MPAVGETRGQVMAAVLAKIQSMTFSPQINGQSSWMTTGNRLKLWGDVPQDQQPACFLVTHNEMDEYRNLGTLRRRLHLGAWCYSITGNPADSTIIGQTDLDIMMQSFEVAFAPDNPSENTLTLGGLVYWCRIEGRVFKDPGDIDGQSLMIVPIIVEMP